MGKASAGDVPSGRIVSLDQFRGYTVAGMFLVNFLGGYAACPRILKHTHDYCSYADTIMPQFLFAVGFAFRLTFERRVQREGAAAAYGRVVNRLLGLVLLSMVIYAPGAIAHSWDELRGMPIGQVLGSAAKREWFQTLMHIAVTSLWILPVIRASGGVRLAFAVLSGAAHILLSYWFNFEWVNTSPSGIDGGPLGFLSWTIPAITGTLACDAVVAAGNAASFGKLAFHAAWLMLLGWGLSCGTRFYDEASPRMQFDMHGRPTSKLADSPVLPPRERWAGRDPRTLLAEPPFVPPPPADIRPWNYWMMSQRAGSVSYLTFTAGFSLLVFAVFHVICDQWGATLPLFRTLGTNALAAYILHDMVDSAVSPFVPRDVPAWYMWSAFAVYFGICWLFLRTLEKNNLFLRL